MQITKHDVEAITYKTKVFDGFCQVTLSITDENGAEMEVTRFADDLKKLTFVNEGVECLKATQSGPMHSVNI